MDIPNFMDFLRLKTKDTNDREAKEGGSFSQQKSVKINHFRPVAESSDNNQEEKNKNSLIVKIFDKIINVSFFFIFLGVPLFFTGLSYQGVVFEKQIYFYFFLLIALVSWAAKGVITGELKIRRTPLDIPIFVFLAAYILTTFFSVDRWHSFWGFFGDPSRGLMNIIALIVAYYLIFDQFNLKKLKMISVAVAVSGFITLIWMSLGISGAKILPESVMSVMPLSPIGSVSGVSAFISFLLPFFISCVFIVNKSENLKSVWKKVITGVLLLAIVLNIFLLLALYSYVPWIGLLIGMGVFLIYILSRIVRPPEVWTWLPMAAFVFVMGILMIGNVNIARVNLPIEVSPAYNLSWEIAKKAVQENFILGSGPATYGYGFSLNKPESFNQNYFYNLRFYQGTGVIAEGLATLGALGVTALILLALSYIGVVFYLITGQKDKNKIFSLGLLSGMIIFIVYALMMRIEGTILILSSLIGAVALASLLMEGQSEEKYLRLTLKASPKYALALAFVFMIVTAGVAYLFVFIGKSFAADIYAGLAIKEREISESGSIGKLTKAVNFNPRESRYYTRIGQEYMVLANNEMVKKEKERNIENVQKYLNLSVQASVKGRDLMKNDVLAVESLAQIYENAGLYIADSLDLAEKTYERSLELEPHNPNYLIKIGQIKITRATNSQDENMKKDLIKEAKGLFEKSLEKKKDLPAAHYYLSVAQEALGETDEAIESVKTAFQLERSNITYAFNLARLYQNRGKDEDNKIAENLYEQILGINENEINTRFMKGLLHEKKGEKAEAIEQFRKVIELLPEDTKEPKERIEKMIENIQKGVSNVVDARTENREPENESPSGPVNVPVTGE